MAPARGERADDHRALPSREPPLGRGRDGVPPGGVVLQAPERLGPGGRRRRGPGRSDAAASGGGRLLRRGVGERPAHRRARRRAHPGRRRHHARSGRGRAGPRRAPAGGAGRGPAAGRRSAARQAGLADRAPRHLVRAHHRHLAERLVGGGAAHGDRRDRVDTRPDLRGRRARGDHDPPRPGRLTPDRPPEPGRTPVGGGVRPSARDVDGAADRRPARAVARPALRRAPVVARASETDRRRGGSGALVGPARRRAGDAGGTGRPRRDRRRA